MCSTFYNSCFFLSVCIAPVVEWDSGGGGGGGGGKVGTKWDGSHHSSTVEQLTSLSRRSLGENGENP